MTAEPFLFPKIVTEQIGVVTDPEKKLRLYEAVVGYGATGVEPDLSDLGDFALSLFAGWKRQIDNNKAYRDEIRSKRSQNGRKGGAPSGNVNAYKIKSATAYQMENADDCTAYSNESAPPLAVSHAGKWTGYTVHDIRRICAELRCEYADPIAIYNAIQERGEQIANLKGYIIAANKNAMTEEATPQYSIAYLLTAINEHGRNVDAVALYKKLTEKGFKNPDGTLMKPTDIAAEIQKEHVRRNEEQRRAATENLRRAKEKEENA